MHRMDQIARHERHLEYDRWANQEVVRSLRAAPAAPASALKTLAHIVAAEELWLTRLQRGDQRVVVWPDLSLVECESAIGVVAAAWREFLRSRTLATLDESVAYTNSKGERWSSRVDDVLTHVVMHSVYHRGQIASEMRRAGATPAYTDFIHAVRQGSVT